MAALKAHNEEELTFEVMKMKLVDESKKQFKLMAVKIGGKDKHQTSATCYFCGIQGNRKQDTSILEGEKYQRKVRLEDDQGES